MKKVKTVLSYITVCLIGLVLLIACGTAERVTDQAVVNLGKIIPSEEQLDVLDEELDLLNQELSLLDNSDELLRNGDFELLRSKNRGWGAKKGTPMGWRGSCNGNWGSRANMGIDDSNAVFAKGHTCVIQTIRPKANADLLQGQDFTFTCKVKPIAKNNGELDNNAYADITFFEKRNQNYWVAEQKGNYRGIYFNKYTNTPGTEQVGPVVKYYKEVDGKAEAVFEPITADADGWYTLTVEGKASDSLRRPYVALYANHSEATFDNCSLILSDSQSEPIEAVADAFSVAFDAGPTILDVFANDVGNNLSIVEAFDDPSNPVSKNADGNLVFDPTDVSEETYSFSYTITNGNGNNATTTVIITIEQIDPITNLTATSVSGGVSLTWSGNSNNETEIYFEQVSTGASEQLVTQQTQTGTALKIACIPVGITTYTYITSATGNYFAQPGCTDTLSPDAESAATVDGNPVGPAENIPPVQKDGTDNEFSVSADSAATLLDVLANFTDPDGDDNDLVIVGATPADLIPNDDLPVGPIAGDGDLAPNAIVNSNYGTIEYTDKTLTYNPDGAFDFLDLGDSETVTFNVDISDADGEIVSAIVTVTIEGVIDNIPSTIQLVADIQTGRAGSDVVDFIAYNDALYFSARSDSNGRELHVFDGNEVRLAADITPGSGSSSRIGDRDKVVFQDKLYFTVFSNFNRDRSLWSYDGTNANPVSSSVALAGGSDKSIVYNNKLVFSGFSEQSGSELWEYDGDNLRLISDIVPGENSSGPSNLVIYDEKLYFTTSNLGNNTQELWQYDALNSSIINISATFENISFSRITKLFVFKNKLVLWTRISSGDYGLYEYDGTSITAIQNNFSSLLANQDLAIYDEKLYFTANGRDLLVYDGNSLIRNTGIDYGSLRIVGTLNNKLYFKNRSSLFSFDGNIATRIAFSEPFESNGDFSFGSYSTVFNNSLYFDVYANEIGNELFKFTP